MKNKHLKSILSPNLWVGVFSLLTIVGLICIALGYKTVGLWLLAPLLVGGLILFVVVIPILIRENRKHKK
jgi:hypothetical protein